MLKIVELLWGSGQNPSPFIQPKGGHYWLFPKEILNEVEGPTARPGVRCTRGVATTVRACGGADRDVLRMTFRLVGDHLEPAPLGRTNTSET